MEPIVESAPVIGTVLNVLREAETIEHEPPRGDKIIIWK